MGGDIHLYFVIQEWWGGEGGGGCHGPAFLYEKGGREVATALLQCPLNTKGAL